MLLTDVFKFRGYRPFFYLTVPESSTRDNEKKWVDKLLAELRRDQRLPYRDLESAKLVYKKPTTGFRNEVPIPCILFRFYTRHAYYMYKDALEQRFPAPTEQQIKLGIYNNDVMLSEERVPDTIKVIPS